MELEYVKEPTELADGYKVVNGKHRGSRVIPCSFLKGKLSLLLAPMFLPFSLFHWLCPYPDLQASFQCLSSRSVFCCWLGWVCGERGLWILRSWKERGKKETSPQLSFLLAHLLGVILNVVGLSSYQLF